MNLSAQVSYTWNGSASSSWNNPLNWTPSSGFPLAADYATIVVAGAAPQLDMARSVANITVNGGVVDLNGFTLTCTGNGTFNGGAVNNGTFTANTTAGIMNFAGTVFGAVVNGSTSDLRFAGSTFNAPVNMAKTGASNDYSSGNTVFNSSLSISMSAGRLYLGNTGTTMFNGDVVLNSTGTSGGIWMGQSTGTLALAAGRTLTTGSFTAGALVVRGF
ncbi:MAG: hypothetical protein JST98_12265, partial [Bacteroidetes bacterium]|nr:hypothetical protein [Bacteroidota bacterium]